MEQVSGDEKIDLIARQFKQDVIKQLNTYDDDRWPPIDLILDYYACRLDYDERIKLEDSLRRWLLEEGFFTGIKLNVFDNKLYCECNLTEKGKKVWCKAERRMIRESKTIFDQISDGCTILFVIAVIFVILIFLGFCVTYCSGS